MTTSNPIDARCWIGLLAPPLAWVLDFQTCYVLSNPVHRWGNKLPICLVTALALTISLTGGAVAWAALRSLGPAASNESRDRTRFMLRAGVALGLFFALTIVAESIPVLILHPTD
jgi:hypothetical protein